MLAWNSYNLTWKGFATMVTQILVNMRTLR
jgi:hypothetical protein